MTTATSEIDNAWVLETLDEFIAMTSPVNPSGGGYFTSTLRPSAATQSVVERLPIIEQILDRCLDGWREDRLDWSDPNYEYAAIRQAATRCRTVIERQAEVDERLGFGAPTIKADRLHPWVWDAARPQWESGHHAAAVDAAARNLNSRLLQKAGRRDVSGVRLVQAAFSTNPAKDGTTQLRVPPDDETETAKSMQVGVQQFGAGCFGAIRNPVAHLPDDEMDIDEQGALKRLSALSLFARWVDEATVVRPTSG